MTATTSNHSDAASGRVYQGFRRERNGWIAGLTAAQAIVCLAVGMPVLLLLGLGALGPALVMLLIAAVVIPLVIWPVRGRPAARWLLDSAWHLLGVALSWSAWQSAVATGKPVEATEPDLPGVLTRIALPEGPVFADGVRIVLIHDTVEGRWGATARLSYSGVGLADPATMERLADGIGELLRGLGDKGIIDRASLLLRSVPDDGTAYRMWRAQHEIDDPPQLVHATTREMDRTASTASIREEAFLTVSAPDGALARSAREAGGGVIGRGHVLYRAMNGLTEPLRAAGAEVESWLDPAGLAEALRTGFNPAAAAQLTADRLNEHGHGSLPLAAAGSTRAPSPDARRYHHDAFTTVSYTAAMPTLGTRFGSLAPLLTVKTPGERRCLAIHYEVVGARQAARIATRERQRGGLVAAVKADKGFTRRAADQRESASAAAQENAVAAGHGLVRYAAASAVTVPAEWNVEAHAEALESAAAGRFPLLRMDLAQDSGFATACLPLGVGLPPLRRL